MASKGSWTKLGLDKLESSGLDKDVGAKLGMYEVPSAKQLMPQFDARAAMVLPYHDIRGAPVKHGTQAFYRVRYLEPDRSFSGSTGKEVRYVQPWGSPSCAYFPHVNGMKWVEIASDTNQYIIFTEGEFKAAAACMKGYPTIGLGGVYSFMDKRNGFLFLKELEEFAWTRRKVYIVYDSDYAENAMVCAAINALMEELQERGAFAEVVTLPDVYEEKDKKTGLDDYLLHASVEDFEQLIADAEPLGLSKKLWRMNNEVVYVQNPGMVVTQDDGFKMRPAAFTDHSRWSTINTVKRIMGKNGSTTIEKVKAAGTWLEWPLRRACKKLVYAPGKETFHEENYNTWPGWGCEPRKGTVKPFLELVDFLFANMEPKSKEWFLDWLAYPIQNPGHKMFTAVIMHSVQQGTGKSLIGYTMKGIYGKNFKEITDTDLESDYTAWAENRQFIMGDEITGNDNRKHAAQLKRIISQREMTINIKHLPQYEIDDVMNYYYTAQHVDSFFLEDTDRRFFVCEVTTPPLADVFYQRYDDWLWREGGPSHLFQWMLDRKISKDFNPNAKAMQTAAKSRMIIAGKGDLASWVHDLRNFADDALVFGKMRYTRDLFHTAELLQIYEAAHPASKVTSNGMSRALAAAQFKQVDGGQPLRGADGKMARHFAIRNEEKWATASSRKAMEQNIKLAPIVRNDK